MDDFDEEFGGFGGVLASVVLGQDVSLDEMLCAFGTIKLKLFNMLLKFQQYIKKLLLYERMFGVGEVFGLGFDIFDVVRSDAIVVLD